MAIMKATTCDCNSDNFNDDTTVQCPRSTSEIEVSTRLTFHQFIELMTTLTSTMMTKIMTIIVTMTTITIICQ